MSSESILKKYSFRSRKKLQLENSKDNKKENPKRLSKKFVVTDNDSLEVNSQTCNKPEVVEDIKTTKLNWSRNTQYSKLPIKIEYDNDTHESLDLQTNIKVEVVKHCDYEYKKSKFEPLNWTIVLENIREMRKGVYAPVDDMGCDQCMDQNATPEVS